MNIKVKATELAKALQIAKALQTGKQSLPVYEATFLHVVNASINIDGGRVEDNASYICAYTASADINIDVDMQGRDCVCAVNTARLYSVVSALSGSISMEADTEALSLTITHKHGTCVLPLIATTNASGESIEPKSNDMEGALHVSIPCWADLRTIYNRACSVKSSDQTRWYPHVVHVEITNGSMTSVVTDGKVVYSATISDARLTSGNVESIIINLPKQWQSIIGKIDAEEVEIDYIESTDTMRLKTEYFTLTTSASNGVQAYPKWRSVLRKYDDYCRVNTEALKSCAGRVSTFGGGAVLRMEVKDGALALSCGNEDLFSKAEESLRVIEASGKEIAIGAMPALLTWMLSFAGDEVTLRYNEDHPTQPIYTEVADGDMAQYIMMMPCRLETTD